MLEPWFEVFSKNEMQSFLVKNIVPKLLVALEESVINPNQQNLDHWNWVMEWKNLLSVHILAHLLDKFFFPKWLQFLAMWLDENPNYEEIANWYYSWKGLLDEKLVSEPVVKEHLKTALIMMDRAVAIAEDRSPVIDDYVLYGTTIPSDVQARMERLAEMEILRGLKDLVEMKCEERSILFMRIPDQHWKGKVVHKVGKVRVCIGEKKLDACFDGLNWRSTSLDYLLDMAECLMY